MAVVDQQRRPQNFNILLDKYDIWQIGFNDVRCYGPWVQVVDQLEKQQQYEHEQNSFLEGDSG